MHDPNLAIVINILSQIFERPVPEDVQDFSPQPDPPANLNLLRRSTSDSPSEVDAAIQGNIDPVGNRDQTFKLLSESANLPALEPFFGRESELGALARLLEPPPQSKASWDGRSAKLLEPGSTSSQQIVSVFGPPGIVGVGETISPISICLMISFQEMSRNPGIPETISIEQWLTRPLPRVKPNSSPNT
jgi:hypothetical protein